MDVVECPWSKMPVVESVSVVGNDHVVRGHYDHVEVGSHDTTTL